MQNREWLSASEAMDQLGVRPQTLYAYVSRGRIEARAQDGDPRKSLYRAADIIELAKTKGEGWTQYRWTNPETKKIAEKVTFVKAVPERGAVVYVGIYK